MKKITYYIILFIILVNGNGCSGYKPIFSSDIFEFEIADYLIEGDKKLGNKIYSKLFNFSKSNSNQGEVKKLYFDINVIKEKNPTSRDSSGKILEYKINLNTRILVKDYSTNKNILDHNFLSSASYKVQKQFSETIKFENKLIEDLLNQIYQELLIKLSENASSK